MRTADGVEITPNLRVWTSDLVRATVVDSPTFVEGGETWFYVEEDFSSRRTLASESRVVTRHPFTGEKA